VCVITLISFKIQLTPDNVLRIMSSKRVSWYFKVATMENMLGRQSAFLQYLYRRNSENQREILLIPCVINTYLFVLEWESFQPVGGSVCDHPLFKCKMNETWKIQGVIGGVGTNPPGVGGGGSSYILVYTDVPQEWVLFLTSQIQWIELR
jgi:hypothetical protein